MRILDPHSLLCLQCRRADTSRAPLSVCIVRIASCGSDGPGRGPFSLSRAAGVGGFRMLCFSSRLPRPGRHRSGAPEFSHPRHCRRQIVGLVDDRSDARRPNRRLSPRVIFSRNTVMPTWSRATSTSVKGDTNGPRARLCCLVRNYVAHGSVVSVPSGRSTWWCAACPPSTRSDFSASLACGDSIVVLLGVGEGTQRP